jgi:L-threonylcarbamoyladenylate synthase
VPPAAAALADAFWPGPLTLVLERDPAVLDVVTGGRSTVAVRVPAHPVAARLLRAFDGGLAAPSANRFGRVSPTRAADVLAELDGAVDLILDGGPCDVGLESTIVEVVDGHVAVLRPGAIGAEALSAVVGGPVQAVAAGPARAPGMLASHYAPATPVELRSEAEVGARVAALVAGGTAVGVVSLHPVGAGRGVQAWDAGGDVAVFARNLYHWLRSADAAGIDVLVAVPPPAAGTGGLGAAIADRLRRAAHR